MKKRHLLMSIGLLAAAWLAFFGDKSAGTPSVEPVARRSAMPSSLAATPAKERFVKSSTLIEADSQGIQVDAVVRIQALQPRGDSSSAASGVLADEGLFSGKVWTPPPPPKPDKPEPPPQPTAPPLPFSYLGKQMLGGQMAVFLARGDEVLVVHEKSVIENNYRVESISPPTLSLLYLPLNQIQQLSIGVTN